MNKIFIDSSFFKALVDPKDDFHEKAEGKWLKVGADSNIQFITSNFILDETFTLLKFKSGRPLAISFKEFLSEYSSFLEVARVTHQDESNAWQWFIKDWKKLSFTDCVSFAQMERLGIKVTASFDSHFERAGFKLI